MRIRRRVASVLEAASIISCRRGEKPRTDSAITLPSLALMLDLRLETRSLDLSGNNPSSSIRTRSQPDAAPAFRSAASTSRTPVADSILPGCGERLKTKPFNLEASAISSACFRSSFAFSFEREATAPRQPRARSGPTRKPIARIAQIADLAFSLAQHRRDHLADRASSRNA